jgi:hypothetical protein
MNDESIKHLHLLLKGCVETARSFGGLVLEDNTWIVDADTVFGKCISHILTVAYLLDKTKPLIQELEISIRFIDYHSINVLTRTALETYLTFYYIFCDDAEMSLKYCRHQLWQLSGLCNRQQINLTNADIRANLDEEIKHIEAIRQSILHSNLLDDLHLKEPSLIAIRTGKLRLLDWKPVGGWTELGRIAKFDSDSYKDIYNLLSVSVHTDISAIKQLDYTDSYQTRKEKTGLAVSVCKIILSLMLIQYRDLFSKWKMAAPLDSEIEKWVNIYASLASSKYTST